MHKLLKLVTIFRNIIPVNPSADPDPGTLDFTWPGAAAYMLLLFEDF